jgi:hypothetical protein
VATAISLMKTPWNPTNDEVRAWAYQRDPVEPVQDWDLGLSIARHDKVYLDLVSDQACPARQYLLRVLYLIVGDAVRTGFRSADRGDIDALLVRAGAYADSDIRRWRERSRDLLAHPEKFTYDAWCAGGLAHDQAT